MKKKSKEEGELKTGVLTDDHIRKAIRELRYQIAVKVEYVDTTDQLKLSCKKG